MFFRHMSKKTGLYTSFVQLHGQQIGFQPMLGGTYQGRQWIGAYESIELVKLLDGENRLNMHRYRGEFVCILPASRTAVVDR